MSENYTQCLSQTIRLLLDQIDAASIKSCEDAERQQKIERVRQLQHSIKTAVQKMRAEGIDVDSFLGETKHAQL
jgi:hypothetical protein